MLCHCTCTFPLNFTLSQSFSYSSVVAKKFGCWLKIKSRGLKEGAKQLILLEEVPIVLYRVKYRPPWYSNAYMG